MIHLIRPYALLLIIPATALLWSLRKNFNHNNQWQKACDPHLLKHLTITNPARQRKWPLITFAFALLIAIVALAGPSWKKTEIPVFDSRSPLVILLDLSNNMTAKDLKPNRLARAKYKIIDLLKARKGGQTGLIAFTSEPFVVTPLTEDSKTIINLLRVLEPSVMPVQGQDVGNALKKAAQMIEQAGARHGQVLVITNNADNFSEAKKLHSDGITVSVLGVGRPDGAPGVDANGRLIKDEQGNLIITKLHADALKKLASVGGGIYKELTPSNADVNELASFTSTTSDANKSKLETMLWQDEGHWLVLLLLPFMALVFRRGYL